MHIFYAPTPYANNEGGCCNPDFQALSTPEIVRKHAWNKAQNLKSPREISSRLQKEHKSSPKYPEDIAQVSAQLGKAPKRYEERMIKEYCTRKCMDEHHSKVNPK
ncbi:hypothetical protein AMTR_s00080p00164230 [Amborella trichopoda]|uniref:Uncharacterized protein n=1 Tax=Amborella trichopoda TaxID=13333 RepID=W1PD42_AMBTC|nr:hypothetical protein AMTR_s00080p00164230 [Amborella trichopoda]